MKRSTVTVVIVLFAIAAGTSGATAGKVSVSASARSYGPGGVVRIAIANASDKRVLVPAGDTWCSLFTVERFARNAWRTVRRCVSEPTMLLAVDAGKTMSGSLARATGAPVSGTATPGRLDIDLRSLPVQTLPPGPPPPAKEVPQGILDPRSARPTLELGPGQYRVVVPYFVGSAKGARLQARSSAFTVRAS
jgi:hypothetical protein